MGVFLDPRDGSGDLIGYFPNGFAEVVNLNSADVMGTGNGPDGPIMWGIEIKKLSDCIDSMQSGRLKEQLGKMQEDYDWKALLIEGHFQQNPKTGTLQKWLQKGNYGFWCDVVYGNKQKLNYSHFMSWIMSMTVCSGTFYLHTTSRQETTDVVVSVARMFDKEWEEHGSLNVIYRQPVPGLIVPSIPMIVVQDMADGLGWKKAIKAAEHFKTVRAMSNATVEEWREVEGIDKVLAQRLVEGATVPHALRRRTRRPMKVAATKAKRGKK